MKKKWEYEKEEDFEDLFIDDIAEEDENAEADQNRPMEDDELVFMDLN